MENPGRPRKARPSASHTGSATSSGTGEDKSAADQSFNSNSASNATTVDQARESLEFLMSFVGVSDQQMRDNAELREKNGKLEQENAALRGRNSELDEENAAIREENAALKAENAGLRNEVAELRKMTHRALTDEIAALTGLVGANEQEIAGLRDENARLRGDVAQLRAVPNESAMWRINRSLQDEIAVLNQLIRLREQEIGELRSSNHRGESA